MVVSVSESNQTVVPHAAERAELLIALERALDLSYAQIRRIARERWEQHFGRLPTEEPNVVVRINQRHAAVVRGSDMLRKSGKGKRLKAQTRLTLASVAR